jgi:23S rRNA pseudouridine2605 synthase
MLRSSPSRLTSPTASTLTERAPMTGAAHGPDHDPTADRARDGERLQKVLARAGIASRRRVEEFIVAGRLRVNGEIAVLGRRVDAARDLIELDGVRVQADDTLVHYLLHKPAGVVSTSSDPQGRPTVIALVPTEPRVYSAGRLDVETEGLLILTNDGDLTQRLTHPSHGVEKEYLAEVTGVPSPGSLRRLREGLELDDGVTAPTRVAIVDRGAGSTIMSLVLHEGRNRQVRRMCAAIGHPVTRLVRVRIGPIADRTLQPGEWRALRADEVRSLDAATVGVDLRAAGGTAQTRRKPSRGDR